MILSDFWLDKVDYIFEFTSPIYDMLQIADTDKPCLHLVYEMWDSTIEKVRQQYIDTKAWKMMSIAHFGVWCMIYLLIDGLKIAHHYIALLIP